MAKAKQTQILETITSPWYPVEAMQRIPSFKNVNTSSFLYPDRSLVGKLTSPDDFDLTDLTETESSSFSWSDDAGFDLLDFLETQQDPVGTLEREQCISNSTTERANNRGVPRVLHETLEATESSVCSFDDFEIEVSRGNFLPLRGVHEVYESLKRGLCIEISCLDCDMRLVCVQDCDCVLCPQCQPLSPVEGTISEAGIHVGGVGQGIFIK